MTSTLIEIEEELQSLFDDLKDLCDAFAKMIVFDKHDSIIKNGLIQSYTHYSDVIENVLKKVNNLKMISQLSDVEETTPIKDDFSSD
jgi:hypothetical protein